MKARKLFFIEVLRIGQWEPTWWTCSPDDPDCKPAKRTIANRRLKVAQRKFPNAIYRIVPAPEQATTETASPHDTTALALPRFGTMQEGSIFDKPQDVGGWIDKKLADIQHVS